MALTVLETNLTAYRRTWRGSVLSSFVLPILFVLGFGVGVGRFVDLGGKLGPVHYLDYIVPGMLASTAVQVAFSESAWPVMSKFQWIRVYHGWVAAPLRIVDIVGGELLFLLVRLVSTAVVFLAVTAAFGAVHSWWAPAAVGGAARPPGPGGRGGPPAATWRRCARRTGWCSSPASSNRCSTCSPSASGWGA